MQVVYLPLQRRDQPGFVVLAAVQLLLQPLVGLGVGRILLPGGDQRRDAPLQLRVLLHRQRVLPDEGAALKYLPWHAQQHLSGVLRRDPGHRRGRPCVGAGKLPHGRRCPLRLPQQRVIALRRRHVHPSLHGRAAPRREAVLVRQRPALPGGQTVQHGADKRAPGGLPRLVGRVQHVQPRRQGQLPLLQPPECGAQTQNIHERSLLQEFIQYN